MSTSETRGLGQILNRMYNKRIYFWKKQKQNENCWQTSKRGNSATLDILWGNSACLEKEIFLGWAREEDLNNVRHISNSKNVKKLTFSNAHSRELTYSYCEVLLKWLVLPTVLYKLSKLHYIATWMDNIIHWNRGTDMIWWSAQISEETGWWCNQLSDRGSLKAKQGNRAMLWVWLKCFVRLPTGSEEHVGAGAGLWERRT